MSAGAGSLSLDQTVWRPKANPWLIGVVVSLAAFMEVLDTSIANVALPHIAGDLGASNDQSTWVLTTYLVSNAIVLPISGWLVGMFGRKRFFLTCIVIFTISSFLCGIAPSLGTLLLFRIVQGAGGGGLQPMAQAILADTFPPEQRGLAFSLYGITAVCAPAIGPTLGGWITDNYSWRWIFYINIPVGIVALLLVYALVEDPPYMARLRALGRVAFDYIGFALLTLGIAALQIVLDKGQEDDWFGSHFITTLAVTAAISLTALVIWEWRSKQPIIDIRLFKNFNFSSASVMFFILGAILFGSTVVLPQFLQTVMGYTAESAGIVLSGGAIVILFLLPFVGKLTTKIQARYLIAFGWLALAIGMYVSTLRTDTLISFGAASLLRIMQAAPLPFLFVPINLAAYVGIPSDKNNAAAGIMNFMRNMGQSVGTSLVTTVVARRSQYHQSVLAEHTGSQPFQDALHGLTQRLHSAGLSMYEAQQQALARLYGRIQAQAATLSYIDLYLILAIAAAVMFFLSFLLKQNKAGQGGGALPAH